MSRSVRARVAALVTLCAVLAALIALLLVPGSRAAGQQGHEFSRSLIIGRIGFHRGRLRHVRLVRIVDAGKLPPATIGPPKHVEPEETRPKTGPPRTTGVIALAVRRGHRGAPEAKASSVLQVSAAGLTDAGSIPPDTQLAVSPKFVVEFVNTAAEVLDHAGTVLQTYDLGSLFSGVAGQGTDPKIVYDSASGMFFAAYIGNFTQNFDGPSEIDLAVTNDPTGNWAIYDVQDKSILQDQPKLGVSSNKLTIAWNDNGNSGPEEYVVIQKAGIVAQNGSVPATFFGPDSTRLNVVPADQLSPSPTAFAGYHNYNSSNVGVLSFTGVPGVSTTGFTESDVTIAQTSAPPAAVQPPSGGSASPTIDTGDDRLESAVWLQGDLWTAGNDVCRFKTDKTSRACLRVINILTTKKTLARDVDITMVGGDVMYPAVMLDAHKDF